MTKTELDNIVKEDELSRKREHYKIISDLILKGTADISNDPKWVALANKYTMALEDYMSCFPEDCQGAMEAAETYRREMSNDGYNRKSLAKYCLMGCLPECVSKLFSEIYPDPDERKHAMRRFFNSFPVFKVKTGKL